MVSTQKVSEWVIERCESKHYYEGKVIAQSRLVLQPAFSEGRFFETHHDFLCQKKH